MEPGHRDLEGGNTEQARSVRLQPPGQSPTAAAGAALPTEGPLVGAGWIKTLQGRAACGRSCYNVT